MARKVSLSKSAKVFDEKFLVGEPVTESAIQEALPVEPTTETNVETQAETPAPKQVETVTLRLPKDTKETPLYLITPVMGKRPRWFEKKRLTNFQMVDGTWEISLPKRAVADRGLMELAVA